MAERTKIRIYLKERPATDNPTGYSEFFGAEVKKNVEVRYPGNWFCEFDVETFLDSCVARPGIATDILEHSEVVGASARITLPISTPKRFQDGSVFVYWAATMGTGTVLGWYEAIGGNAGEVVRFYAHHMKLQMAEMPEEFKGYRNYDLGTNRPTIWDVLGNTFPRLRRLYRKFIKAKEDLRYGVGMTWGRC